MNSCPFAQGEIHRMFTIALFVILKEVETTLASSVREGINNWLYL